LNLKLSTLDEANQKRRKLAQLYIDGLEGVSGLRENDYGKSVYHLFVVKVESRKRFQEYLHDGGVQTLIHYPVPISEQKAFQSQKGEIFPVTQQFASEIVSLPLYPELSNDSVNHIIEIVNDYDR
jgi:dTDP-4-amino-4,6-dideoxygalactose transaminase